MDFPSFLHAAIPSMNREPLVPLVASPFRHYINGGWETGATTGVSFYPSDLDEPVGEYVCAGVRQTDAAFWTAVKTAYVAA